jgi:hypothetical protein
MTTSNELIDSLRTIAKSQWDASKQPVLLSNLPPLLAEKNANYREALAGISLKEFVKNTEGTQGKNYKLVTHPSQSAKLGLVPIPEGESFEFLEIPTASEQSNVSDRSSEKSLIDFLKALKKLPPKDLAEVSIPIAVLVKMLK